MNTASGINRRQFVQLGALSAAGAALMPGLSHAAPAPQVLPDLPYGTAALEPHIDSRTMEIHHGKHHAAYVAGLNAALEQSPDLAGKPLEDILASLPAVADDGIRTALRNHGGGHWNHAMFWKIMAAPADTGKASDNLAAAIAGSFGSMDVFKQAFADAAAKRFGSGWAWLILRDGKLAITSTPNQDNPLMKGIVPDSETGTPILGVDVWEHAYYLHYQNRRGDYLAAWWNVVDWNAVSQRFAGAAR
jgi:Fe-Mn family superoxide dismutase